MKKQTRSTALAAHLSKRHKAPGQIPSTGGVGERTGKAVDKLKSLVAINSLERDQTQGKKTRYLRSRIPGEAAYGLHLLRTTSWSPSDFVGSNSLSTLPVSLSYLSC